MRKSTWLLELLVAARSYCTSHDSKRSTGSPAGNMPVTTRTHKGTQQLHLQLFKFASSTFYMLRHSTWLLELSVTAHSYNASRDSMHCAGSPAGKVPRAMHTHTGT
jgi:hypothetical protein